MNKVIKWGIMGPGGIAHKFVKSLKCIEDAEATAVGSRSKDRADEFARQYGIARSYGSYKELANDKDVDIIYVATPHSAHYECALMCLKAGKAVLCEKSFTMNSTEAEKLICTARESSVFLMEAMWTRFLPSMVKVRELLTKGVIGDIRMVKADFGFRSAWNPESRILDPLLGGGALLDAGIYPISFASMILGSHPSKITGLAHIGTTGVDEQFSAVLGYDEGRLAVLSGAIRTALRNEAWIHGTDGYIRIPDFFMASKFELRIQDTTEQFNIPYLSTGYTYEATEAMRCLRENRLDSEIMPLDESLEIMRIMDSLREQWGLKYPFE
jgi:dihydrodiol dehydrogenase / D-xylose 1-dehydrogenase (NADP)